LKITIVTELEWNKILSFQVQNIARRQIENPVGGEAGISG
jgi:hypothetical protein